MGVVTEIKMNKAKKRVTLFIDGAFAFSLDREIALEHKLETGMDIDLDRISHLKAADEQKRCFEAACRLLDFRPRSEEELSKRLARKGFSGEAAVAAIQNLKSKGLVDDLEFARFWAENRQNFKPQSAALTRRELISKGIDRGTVEKAVEGYDDYENARQAAKPKALKSTGLDYPAFRRRIGSFLVRRGFGYGVINPVIERLWQEVKKEEIEP